MVGICPEAGFQQLNGSVPLPLGRSGPGPEPWSPLSRAPAPALPSPHLLGHGTPWQPFVSRPLPLQFLPPIWGTGELQRRMRVMLPTPQVTEQDDQGDQWLQPPSCRTSTQTRTRASGRPLSGRLLTPSGGEEEKQPTPPPDTEHP